MQAQVYFDNYTAVGDITVIAMSMAMLVLLAVSYIKKNKSSALFLNIIIYLLLAAFSNVICHTVYTNVFNGDYTLVYVLRVLYHALLFSILMVYVVYIVAMLELEMKNKVIIMSASSAIYSTVIIVDIVTTANGRGFRLDGSGKQVSAFNIFLFGYVAFIAVIMTIMLMYGKRYFRRVMVGFYANIMLSFILLAMQGRHGQTSFTTVSFLFPTVAMLYLLHSNPYDIVTGVTNLQSFEDTVAYYYKRKIDFLYVSLYLPDHDHEGADIPDDIKNVMKNLASTLFKGVTSFQLSHGHIIYVAKRSNNRDFKRKSMKGIGTVTSAIERNGCDYKIIMGSSDTDISSKNCYVSFIGNIHKHMNVNEVHISSEEDVKNFKEFEYIQSELLDIYKKKDLDDERVLAYCQPVYNAKKDIYDSAETLMRLQLPESGLVPPYKFIPIAEEFGYINVLTRIILYKTCKEIKALEDEGYYFKRISVNLSVLDIRNANFTEEVMSIIKNTGITEKKVAFEITESQSEYDLKAVKDKIDELKEFGIKFYLDDFGTGFSNMERLLELPFDIIKFDRSLVIASNADKRSEKMVGSLAHMFSDLNYRVLYEGVEDENDELRCRNMSASYLQGFKYSKPIPIHDLRNFFEIIEGEENKKLS